MPSQRGQRAFTLIEVMVAAAVLAIGLISVVGLQVSLFQSARSSADISNASLILQHRTEELGTIPIAALDAATTCRGAAPGCLNAATGGYAALPGSGCSEQVFEPRSLFGPPPPPVIQGKPYRLDTGIQNHDANHPNARVATVSVCWEERNGRVRQIQTVRVLGDR